MKYSNYTIVIKQKNGMFIAGTDDDYIVTDEHDNENDAIIDIKRKIDLFDEYNRKVKHDDDYSWL